MEDCVDVGSALLDWDWLGLCDSLGDAEGDAEGDADEDAVRLGVRAWLAVARCDALGVRLELGDCVRVGLVDCDGVDDDDPVSDWLWLPVCVSLAVRDRVCTCEGVVVTDLLNDRDGVTDGVLEVVCERVVLRDREGFGLGLSVMVALLDSLGDCEELADCDWEALPVDEGLELRLGVPLMLRVRVEVFVPLRI